VLDAPYYSKPITLLSNILLFNTIAFRGNNNNKEDLYNNLIDNKDKDNKFSNNILGN